ncbi:MAG: hypothetical protein FWJ90_08680 [Actinomadura sp.]
MSLAIAMWVLIPTALYLVFMRQVLLVGVRTKNIKFRSRDASSRPPTGRIGPLVNVTAGPSVESRSGPRAT